MQCIHTGQRNLRQLFFVLVAMIAMLTTNVAAAGEATVNNVKISDTASLVTDNQDGTVTIKTESSGFFGNKNNTITLTNNLGTKATLKFTYVFSSCSTYTIDGESPSSTSGTTKEILLEDQGTVTIYIATGSAYYKTAQVDLSDITLTEAKSTSKVTFEYDGSLGSVSVDGTNVANGESLDLSLDTAVQLKATENGGTFLCWVDAADNSIIDSTAEISFTATKDMTVKAAFASSSGGAWFRVGNDYLFDDLNEAITYAQAAANKTIVPVADGTLLAGDYTIPTGVTLLIPYDDNDTLCTTSPTVVTSGTAFINLSAESYSTPKAHRTLTMAQGANITIASGGAMSLSGKHNANQGSNGHPYGSISFVCMNSGSSITVKENGNLYAWGFITGPKNSSGKYDTDPANCGKVLIESGGTVYEDFQIRDWRGGTAASAMIDDTFKAQYQVFPLSQYYAQNIEVPMTLQSGAVETGSMSVVASKVKQTVTVPFIGETGMFNVTMGSMTKRYDGTTDRLIIDINGDMTISPLAIEVTGYPMNSDGYVLPVNGNMTVNINSGTVIVGQDLGLLPGAKINIGENGKFVVDSNKNVYVYDSDNWGLYAYSGVRFSAVRYAPGRAHTREEADMGDANITVAGTIDASAGAIYTTQYGGAVTGIDGGQAIVNPGTKTETYQATQSGTDITPVSIPINPSYLKNGDGNFVATAAPTGTDTTYTYSGSGNTGTWNTNTTAVANWYWTDNDKSINTQVEFRTLANAIDDYYDGSGYIQMVGDTTEADISATKTVYLDLNGKNITMGDGTGTLTLTALYAIDSATNALGAAGSSYGTITGTVAANLDKVYQCDFGPHINKTYVAVQDTASSPNTLSYHRVRLGIDHYTYYINGETGALTFNAAFLGDSKAMSAMTDLGMNVNEDTTTYWVGGIKDAEGNYLNGITNYAPADYEQTADYNYGYDAEKYVPSGYSLELTFKDLTSNNAFDVSALLKVNGETLDSNEHTGHNASGVSIADYITTTTGE